MQCCAESYLAQHHGPLWSMVVDSLSVRGVIYHVQRDRFCDCLCVIVTFGITQWDNTAYCLPLFSSLTMFSLFLVPYFLSLFFILDFPQEANSDSSWANQLFTSPFYLLRLLGIKQAMPIYTQRVIIDPNQMKEATARVKNSVSHRCCKNLFFKAQNPNNHLEQGDVQRLLHG